MAFRTGALACAAMLVAGCASGNQALYEPSVGPGAPQCRVADVPPRPAYTPPASPASPAPTRTRTALAPWEQHARSGQMVAEMAAAGARVGRMLEQARAQRDVVKTLCMNDKLSQIDVALKSAIERKAAIGSAAARGEVDESAHEFAVMTALKQRVDQLSAEANQCVGEEMAYAAETVVTVQAPPRLSADMVRRVPGVSVHSSYRESRPAPPPPAPPRGPSGGQGAAAAGANVPAKPPAPPVPAPAPAGSPAPRPASVLTTDAPHDPSLMVYTAEVGLAVRHVGEGLDAIDAIARGLGGFLSQRADRQITVMVPRERFIDALTRIERLGDVRHRAVTALDVTDELVDLEVRLTNARAIRERLLELRKAATTVTDQLEIERELGRVTGEIDRMEGKLKLLSQKIAYSTITVSLEPVAEPIVCATTVLPFPWIQDIGLASLLSVHD